MKKVISVKGILEIASLGISLLTIFSSFFHNILIFELSSHFKLQYLFGSVILLLFYAIKKKKIVTIWFLILTIYNSTFIVPWYLNKPNNIKNSGTEIKLFHANVFTSNTEYNKLTSLLEKENPDIICLQEINFRWNRVLLTLAEKYPHRISIPRNDNFGISLYSKFPLIDQKEVTNDVYGVPSISAIIELSDTQKLNLITTHPVPPINNQYFELRNSQLEFIADKCAGSNLPTVLIGDLNISMWSQIYKNLCKKAKLTNSRKGFGLITTWPTSNYLKRIPIDHCLISDGITVLNAKSCNSINSDHLPIIVNLSIQKKQPSN